MRTKKNFSACRLLASVFFLPNVIIFSANRWASFALCHVVEMLSCSIRDVTRFRRSALRCADDRERCRYFTSPPAILQGAVSPCEWMVRVAAMESGGAGRVLPLSEVSTTSVSIWNEQPTVIKQQPLGKLQLAVTQHSTTKTYPFTSRHTPRNGLYNGPGTYKHSPDRFGY